MRRIDIYFLLLAAMSLAAGVILGIRMGISHDLQLSPCTRISTCSAGRRRRCSACYRAYPSLARARLAAVHFALAAVSALAFPVGVALAVTNVTVAVAIVASLLWLGGAVIFLANLVRLLAAPAAGPAAIAERSEAVIRDP